jgi:DNA-binding response OmpR family regulator
MIEKMRLRILVVEANIALGEDICELLELDNHVALATNDPYAAHLVIESFCPNLLMISFSLYFEYGFIELINHCRNYYPIIYLCSNNSSARFLKREGLFWEDVRILEKPFDCYEMMATIEELGSK